MESVNALQFTVFLYDDGHVDLGCTLSDHFDVDVVSRQALEHARSKTRLVFQILANHADSRSVMREPQQAKFPECDRRRVHSIFVDGFADGHADAGVGGADEVHLHLMLGENIERPAEENAVLMFAVVVQIESFYVLFAADGRDATCDLVLFGHFGRGLQRIHDCAPAGRFKRVQNMHRHLTFDETVHGQWVKNLVAKVGKFQGFNWRDGTQQSGMRGG